MLLRFSSLILLLLTCSFFPTTLQADDTLSPTQHLDGGNGSSLISQGSRFELGFFSPAGSSNRYIGIWYHNISFQTVVWVANRQRPIAGRSGRLSIMADGTLIITDNSTVTWSTSSPALADPVARLLDSGNFVVAEKGVADSTGSFAWESFNFPTDTLLPGMKLGWDLTSRTSHNLTAWSSPSDPSPGKYVTGIDLHGDPQIFLWSGSRPYWRGGPWNGIRFSGIPQMKVNLVRVKFVVNSQEVAISYSLVDPSIISRIVTNSSGVLEHVIWIEERKSWSVVGFAPRDECDGISLCGPEGVCYANGVSMCSCMRGFRAKNSSSWDMQDWLDGCARKTSLDCSRNGSSDGFLKQASMKLPDTSSSTVDRSMGLEQCRDWCLRNCSCTAYASANLSGSGCIIWTNSLTDIRWFDSDLGQDLYVRLAAPDLDLATEGEYSHRSHSVAIVLVAVLTIVLLGVCGGGCCVCRRKLINRSKHLDEVENVDLPLYDLATIVNATGAFSVHNKLGEGGFGPVYKGMMSRDEKYIAVKRLSNTSTQGVDEFKNEVSLIAKLQHRNLVRLLGCCIEGGERMLIYEYMPNGSLDAFLFDETKSLSLDWATRYDIILGISRGLLYLHEDSRLRIIHRDLKASNILLDQDMSPKISDFGMARIFKSEESEVNTKRVVGTYGYMSPEYAMEGIFSIKSDVFSFGVLILEIVTGRRNRASLHSEFHQNLIDIVWSFWKEDKALEVVISSIRGAFPTDQVLSCIKMGLLCIQDHPANRPTMSSVVKLLGSDSSLLPEPQQPTFVASVGPSMEVNSATSKPSSSINSMSMTMPEGR